jgi:predicted ATP-grasp superfamily ATP-dependent carboligase
MSICFYQNNNKSNISPRTKERFRLVDEKILNCCLEKTKIDKIIRDIFTEFCGASVTGYDCNQDKYLCKKYIKSDCILHLEIKVISNNDYGSQIIIKPLIGTDGEIKSFMYDFNESIQMYVTSNFIRSILYRP